jgi:hypothetical protein
MQRNGKILRRAPQARRLADMRNGWKHASTEQRVEFLHGIEVLNIILKADKLRRMLAEFDLRLGDLGIQRSEQVRQARKALHTALGHDPVDVQGGHLDFGAVEDPS